MKAITLKQQVYQALKAHILDGEFALGEKLNIDAICKELSVSNSPVREALTLLVKDNLVVMHPNTGAHVIELTPSIYDELINAVNILLLGAYEICCRTNKKQLLLEQLTGCFDKFLDSVSSGNNKERLYSFLLFDRCFVTATENNTCIDMFDSRLDFLYLAYIYNHQNRSIDWQNSIDRNRAMIKAIQEDQIDIVKNFLCQQSISHLSAD